MAKQVWIFQYAKEVKKKGAADASWYVGWYDFDGRRHAESCGPGSRGKNLAEKKKRQLQGELDQGVHQPFNKKKWSEFREEYEQQIVPNLSPNSREQVKATLGHFERIIRPGLMDQITTHTIDSFIARRRTERGRNPKSKIAAATINKDLRHIKAALRVALDWEYLRKMPKIRMVREPEKLVRFVTPEDFEKIYQDACPLAEIPLNPQHPLEPAVWWRALLATAYMTGWRIGELMAMRVEDLDLEAGTVITRHGDNKGKRDEKVPIHPVVVEHLRPLVGKSKFVFLWSHGEKLLWQEFGRIQRAVGIHLTCLEDHEHTPPCHVYGFHDCRRGFATVSAEGIDPKWLQRMMRHKSYKTTLGYINRAQGIATAVQAIKVPDAIRPKAPPTTSPAPNADAGST